MRRAVVVAPKTSWPADAVGRTRRVGWLCQELGALGFQVTAIGEGADLGGELARALVGVAAHDRVLVHVSGRLAADTSLCVHDGLTVPLATLSTVASSRLPTNALFIVELGHDGPADDALYAADCVAAMREKFDRRSKGPAALIAVHPAGANDDPLAFTRLTLHVADEEAEHDGNAVFLSDIVERLRSMPESYAAAQSYAYVRGAVDFVFVPKVREDVPATPADRADALFDLARSIVAESGDLPAAVAELEKARAVDPTHEDTLEALRRAYRTLSRWPQLLEVTGALADRAPSSAERAARRFAQARIALDHLHDDARGLLYVEAALEADPTHDEALEVLISLRASRGETSELEIRLAALVAHLEELGDAARAEEASQRLEALRAGGAEDDDDRTLFELESAVMGAPLLPTTYLRLFAVHARSRATDRAYLTALALEELGVLEPEHQLVLDQCRPDGLRVRASIDDSAWELLRAPGSDDVLEALFGSIARAAAAARHDERRARRQLVSLDPSRRQQATSTASIVRSFHWAARVLGIPCPDLYVLDDVPGDIAAVPAREPSVALGPGVLRGLSTKDLAFVAARHLTYYRPEYSVLVHFPTLHDLTLLLLAAVSLAIPEMPMPESVAPAVATLRTRLEHHLTDGERAAMAHAVERLDERGGRVDLRAWIQSIELTAGRAGLLLCGDLRTAMNRLRGEARTVADVRLEDKRADLLSFCASSVLADLRGRFAVVASTPPRSSGVMPRSGYEETTATERRPA